MMVADKFPNGLIGPIGLNPNGLIGLIGLMIIRTIGIDGIDGIDGQYPIERSVTHLSYQAQRYPFIPAPAPIN